MRTLFLALALAGATTAGAQSKATDIPSEDIQATVKRTAEARVSDQAIRVVDVDGRYNVGIGVVHRSAGAQGAIAHSRITEIYHVMEGTATLVTGGTLVDPKPVGPESQVVKVLNGPSTSGPSIEGGESRRIKAGDVVILPPGTPHWFSAIDGQIVYLVVRVDPDRVLQVR